jgi:hypothetical protein
MLLRLSSRNGGASWLLKEYDRHAGRSERATGKLNSTFVPIDHSMLVVDDTPQRSGMCGNLLQPGTSIAE